jgi:tRNA pseudouridine55 synthase
MNSLETPAGILLVDKPIGISSFDCIRALRRQTGLRKFGHAGTLDPMATGLMIILVGGATKQADRFLKQDKTYTAQLSLGHVSSTGDAEGELTAVSDRRPAQSQVAAALKTLTGQISQIPPAYSAIKINGQPAYRRIRRGEEVVIPARTVTIYTMDLDSYAYPHILLHAHVSSGTYIRTLAADIGQHLHTGAYLSALRRTSIGDYSIKQAHKLSDISAENFNNYLMKLRDS